MDSAIKWDREEAICLAGGIVHRGVMHQTMNIRLATNENAANEDLANNGKDYFNKQELWVLMTWDIYIHCLMLNFYSMLCQGG